MIITLQTGHLINLCNGKKSSSYHCGTKMSSFAEVFELDAKLRLITLALPNDVIYNLQSGNDSNKSVQLV